jgi:SAM-dependent methyltransferase
MSAQIIGLHDFFQTPQGRYLLEWEQAQFDRVVADIFGFHALQLGCPELDALQTNRMPHRWQASNAVGHTVDPAHAGTDSGHSSTATEHGQRRLGEHAFIDLHCDFAALPFPANSLDLVVLPHTLELDADPHATLREVERVLVPEGRVVICGVNPASLWGLRQRRAHVYRRFGVGQLYLPTRGRVHRVLAHARLAAPAEFRGRVGPFRLLPPRGGGRALAGAIRVDGPCRCRWWPIFGAVYFLVAVKRVRGMRLLGRSWKTPAARPVATVPVANRHPAARTHDTRRIAADRSPSST